MFARTVIDGEDTLIIRCAAPNIQGTFVEYHYRAAERLQAIRDYQVVIYTIAKLCLHDRAKVMSPEAFARQCELFGPELERDRRIAKIGLIPADVDWHF